MDNKKIVLSGIRPTGQLHLGNYLGALSNFVKMQNEGKYDSYYFIADLHALTTNPDPKELHTNVRHILAEYLAAGLDPEKSTIFVQSDIPEVSEMYLLLNMHVGIGELMRTAAFKDKARKALGITAPNQGDDDEDVAKEIIGASTNKRVNAGLLTYPTLMAVDILIQRADFVPVGKDQEQHLELTRRFARRFNSFYKLDGSGKMGKSEGNCIYLVDDEKTIRKKVMRAVTDGGPTEPNQPMAEPVQNLFTILKLVGTPDKVEFFTEAYNNCSIRYGDLKKEIAEDIVAMTTPIRERIIDIENDDAYLHRVLEMGAERARARAGKTLADVREIMGITKF